jgi:hypothetical protein
MKRLLLVLLIIGALAACSSLPTSDTPTPDMPTPDSSSGVFGQVTIGPMCPVVRIGKPCPDQPYQATLDVLTASGDPVTRITTDAECNFRVSLVPGGYILRPESPGKRPLPTAQEQQFTVVAGQFTELLVTFDSGIR